MNFSNSPINWESYLPWIHQTLQLPYQSQREMEGSFVSHAVALLFMLQLAASMAASSVHSETNTQFIRTSCSSTTYPQLCYNSLSNYASKIQASPKLLANAALTVTLRTTQSTSSALAKLSKSQGLKPREAAAMLDCVEVVGDAVDELQKSIAEMGQTGGADLAFQINNIQTWVSAALTDENACMDGFAGNAMNGNVNVAVRRNVVNIAHMTSNALSLVNSYAST